MISVSGVLSGMGSTPARKASLTRVPRSWASSRELTETTPVEDRSRLLRDGDRRLTDEGRLRMQAVALALREKLPEGLPVLLLTSPLVRAVETAEILERSWGIQEILTEESLGDGDLRRFLAGLRQLPADSLVAAVGHEPWLSRWAEMLCGHPVHFSKGGSAFFRLNPADISRGELLWTHTGNPR